ncbi:hypothetical protein [Methylorubrum zatmanii]
MADPQNKVPFFLAGDGAYLRFRTADLIKLEDTYGEDWQSAVFTGLARTSHKVMVACLQAGLKQEDGRKPYSGVSFDDLPFSIDDAATPIIDAITLGISGKPYAELVEARREAAANPPPESPSGSASESFEPDTPPVS